MTKETISDETPELASAAYQQAAQSSNMKEYFPDD